jgi:hypothetical protein
MNNGVPFDVDLQVDDEGHCDYTLSWNVETTLGDGPDEALYGSGMPIPGSAYASNPAAYYQRKGSARLKDVSGSKRRWVCQTVFSTRPAKRCQDTAVGDPLSEPHRIRGSFARYTEEIRADKDGDALLNSANEPITGLTREASRPTFEIEQNVAWIDVDVLKEVVDAVNSSTIWGLADRTLRCQSLTWEQLQYGACYKYFHVVSVFEIKEETWDYKILDQGNMVKIAGSVPAKFRRAKDEFEETCRVLLDNFGNATNTPTYLPDARVLREVDFSMIGWPAVLF